MSSITNTIIIMSLFIFACCVIPAADATTTDNFTRTLPYSDKLVVNQTFTKADNTSTPFNIWLIVVIIGLVLLFGSMVCAPEQCNDIMAYLAPFPLLTGTLMSFAIDVKTSQGGGALFGSGDAVRMVIVENHVVYGPYLLIILMAVFFVISLANVVRVRAQHQLLGIGENVE